MSRKPAAIALFATCIALEVTFVTGFLCGQTFERLFLLSKTQEGICLGAMSIGMAVMSLLAGHATHRWGPMAMLVKGTLGMMLGIVLVTVAGGFASLLVGLATIGLSSAFVINAFSTLFAELFPEQVRRVMALASALWFISSGLTAPVIGAWLSHAARHQLGAWSYRAPFLVDLAANGLCLVLVLVLVGPAVKNLRPAPEAAEAAPATRSAVGRWEWVWIPVLGACHGVMIISLRAWGDQMVLEKFGVSEVQGALLLGLLSLGLGLGRLMLAVVHIPVDDRLLLAVAGFAGGILIALGLAAQSYVVSLVVISVGGFVSAPSFPCLMTLVGTRFAAAKAHVFGYMEASVGLTGLLGPALVGVLADRGLGLWLALGVSPIAAFLLGASSIAWKLQRPSAPATPE